jgi:hypothetical protein
MAGLKEQCVCIGFCFELGKMLQICSEISKVASESRQLEEQKLLWVSKVRSSVNLVEDAEHLECRSTSKTGGKKWIQ